MFSVNWTLAVFLFDSATTKIKNSKSVKDEINKIKPV